MWVNFWTRDCFGFVGSRRGFFGVEILAPIRSSLALEIRSSLLGRHFSVKNSKVLLGGLRFMYEANMSTLFAAGRSVRA